MVKKIISNYLEAIMDPKIPSSVSGQVFPTTNSQNVIGKIPTGNTSPPQQGTILNALVVRHDNAGNPVIATQAGEITLASKIFLPNGSSLTLKILANTALPDTGASNKQITDQNFLNNFQAQIISVNGKPPDIPRSLQNEKQGFDIVRAILNQPAKFTGTQSPQPQPNLPNIQNSEFIPSTNAAIVNISKGTILEAVVISTLPGAEKFLPRTISPSPAYTVYGDNQNFAPSTPLKIYDNITVHIVSSKLPETANAITQSLSTKPYIPTASQNYSHSLSGTALIEGETISPPISQGNRLTENSLFSGVVIGTEKSGELVLKTPLGTLKIQVGIDLPPGTELELEAIKIKSQQPVLEQHSVTDITHQKLLGNYQLMQQLLSLLSQIDIENGTAILKKVFPTTSQHQAAKLLWFIINVNSGNFSSWLGNETINLLEKNDQKEFLGKLEQTFANMRALFAEPNNAGWHTLMFPVFDGQKLQYGQFHIRRDEKKNKKDGDKSKDVRFVVELETDMLGKIQFDGFVKTVNDETKIDKHLDLFIRTRNVLPPEMQRDIIDIFIESNEITGLKGNLQFQVVKEFAVNPLQEGGEIHDSIIA